MLRPDSPCSMSSAEKKRLRDRRAQQNLRDKKLRHTTQLEERVAYCEQNHNDQSVGRLLQVIEGLRQQNETLLSRQRQLSGLVRSWDVDGPAELPSPSPDTLGPLHHHQKLLQAEREAATMSTTPPAASTATTFSTTAALPTRIAASVSSPAASPVESVPSLTSTCPPWKLIPLNNDDFSSPEIATCPWFCYPDRIAASPATPSSPLDILYGTKTNPLADMIHTRLRSRPLRDPECLAFGWSVYHMTKWMFAPSPDSYARIPNYLKPVLGQLQTPHPATLDFMIWPELRLNLMERWHVYREYRDDLFGLFTCCVKVRWPWGEKILERDETNELCIRREFYEAFMSLEGWGLTPEFVRRYPDVVAGADVRSILYEVV